MRTSSRMLAGCVLVCLAFNAGVADAQSSQAPATNLQALQGTVVSTSRTTLVLKTSEGLYQVFVLDRETSRPQVIPLQSQVAVTFMPTGDPAAPPSADTVTVTAPPPQVAALTGEVPPQGQGQPPPEPIPGSVRKMESDIKRQTQRWRLGVRGATSLDPEMFMFGVHSQLGPFFSDNLYARPNLELGFGELTSLIALNFEAVYRLPVIQRTSRWNVYAGGGPALNFSRRSFEEESSDRNPIDFSDLSLDVGFNFLLGLQNRDGMFLELKTSAYSIPTIRFEIGYNF
jgi:hypothetical protein